VRVALGSIVARRPQIFDRVHRVQTTLSAHRWRQREVVVGRWVDAHRLGGLVEVNRIYLVTDYCRVQPTFVQIAIQVEGGRHHRLRLLFLVLLHMVL